VEFASNRGRNRSWEYVANPTRPIDVLFNLTSLHYELGDAIGAIAVPL